MKEYFLGMVIVVFVSAFVISLCPDGSMGKHLRLLCGLCVVGCIVIPLISYIQNVSGDEREWINMFASEEKENANYDEIYNKAFLNVESENAENNLKSQIIKELSIDAEDFDVQIYVEDNSDVKSISRVEVIIYASGVDIDPHRVEKYINELLDCQCVIRYDI